MFSSDEYLWGWVLYALASIGLMVVWWFMTRWISFQVIRNTLRVIVAAALLMPYPVDSESSFLAPAIIITFVEGLFVRGGTYDRAGIPLLIAIIGAAAFYAIVSILWNIFWEKRKGNSSSLPSKDDSESHEGVLDDQDKVEQA
ncbi:MAG: hypothetical protein K6L75_02275 [Cellvibrionaceae bacterium]